MTEVVVARGTRTPEGASEGMSATLVAPGYIGTEMIMAVPEKILNEVIILATIVGRLGQVEEVARYVIFLASDEVGFFTSSTPTANGGRYMS